MEAQLLREVVAQERGELEAAKERLLLSLASDTRQLQDLQDRILKLLKVGHHVLCPGQACGVSASTSQACAQQQPVITVLKSAGIQLQRTTGVYNMHLQFGYCMS